jgi:hypothetical protein
VLGRSASVFAEEVLEDVAVEAVQCAGTGRPLHALEHAVGPRFLVHRGRCVSAVSVMRRSRVALAVSSASKGSFKRFNLGGT